MKASMTPGAYAAASPKQPRCRNSLKELFLELRAACGLTQLEAAKLIGLSRATVANMESGRQAVAIESLERLAAYKGLEVVVTIREKEKKG